MGWMVTPRGILKEEELPETWGHHEAMATGLRMTKFAPVRANPAQRGQPPQADAAIVRPMAADESRPRRACTGLTPEGN
jgi:hypothetical protein